jgi:hypothetical protein
MSRTGKVDDFRRGVMIAQVPDACGEYTCGTHFTFASSQVRSFLSLLSYLGKGESSEREKGRAASAISA